VNPLDFLLLLIVGYSVVAGFLSGFARVGIGFAATLLAILCGLWFYGIPAAWLAEYFGAGAAANLLGFFFVFSIIVLLGAVLGRVAARVFKWVGLSWLDRFLGAGFGLVRGAVLAVAIVTVITAFAPNPPPRFIVNSRTMPYATSAGRVLAALAPHDLKQAYRDSLDKLRVTWDRVKLPAKPEKMKGQTF
jgi:membrane protein required for colicin V production